MKPVYFHWILFKVVSCELVRSAIAFSLAIINKEVSAQKKYEVDYKSIDTLLFIGCRKVE